MKSYEQLPCITAILIFFLCLFSTSLSSQEISGLDKYFEYLPSDQNWKTLNCFVSADSDENIRGGFQFASYKNTEKTQSLFELSSAYSNDLSSIGNSLGDALGIRHLTELAYRSKMYIKDNLFVGAGGQLSFATNARTHTALLGFQTQAGFGRIYRIEEKATVDRIISKLTKKGMLISAPSQEHLYHFAALIGDLRNDRKLTNRDKAESELELLISFLQNQGLVAPSVDLGILAKTIHENYKYEFLAPRESGKTLSLVAQQEYLLSNLGYYYTLWDKRIGAGIRYDQKKYISEKLQWNSFASVDLFSNTVIQEDFGRFNKNYFSVHAEASSRLDYYISPRSRFGAQFSVGYDHYMDVPSVLLSNPFNSALVENRISARLDLDYEFQFSRKSSIAISNYFEYSKNFGLEVGLGLKFRF